MDYRKLDSALASALYDANDPESRDLNVFIQTLSAPGDQEADILEQYGVRGARAGRRVFTATLSPKAVEELANQPWVQGLGLSQKLRFSS